MKMTLKGQRLFLNKGEVILHAHPVNAVYYSISINQN